MSAGPAYPALATVAGIPAPGELCRVVERVVLERTPKSDFLFTSGRPGRYNPRGIEALYASEDQATAGAEAERYRAGRVTQNVVYWVRPNALVLDLGNPTTVAALGLVEADLFSDWKFAPAPTRSQLLGEEVAQQSRLAGIRFPSDAAKARGFLGYNIVFFKKSVVTPSAITVHDDTGREVQRWP